MVPLWVTVTAVRDRHGRLVRHIGSAIDITERKRMEERERKQLETMAHHARLTMLGEVAFLFGPADYCALMLVGFVCVSFVTTGSLLNGMAMCLIGVLLGQIGTDVNSGMPRFTLDLPFLAEGVGLVSIALGCFGIAEITKNLRREAA